jgi:myo-inositol 2-dehydrogenase/D-chiro-inositol 1-dehydrogenase
MKPKSTRRRFLCASSTVLGTLAIIPRFTLGQGKTAPSDVITRGVIGTGGQGMGGHVTVNAPDKPAVTLAVCDVDKKHLERALAKTARSCDGYADFRKLLERKDIDTIHIATPPHWHAPLCVYAAQAGKDILCEKPLTRFIREGQAVIDAVQRYGRVLQLGTYGRFGDNARRLRKLFSSGLLGGAPTVRVGKATGYNWKVKECSGKPYYDPQPIPPQLDYDFWLGPAPHKPYHPHRVHASFRGYWDYDGGGLADMGQHYLDPIQYALGKDDTSPVEIEAYAPPAHPDAVGLWGHITLKYADRTTLIIESGEWGEPPPNNDAFIQTEKYKIKSASARGQSPQLEPLYEQSARLPDPPPLITFETAVKTRRQPGGNASVSHRSVSLLHLCNIAIRLGRKLDFDPVKQIFPGDDQANRLVDVPMRAPWQV